jgi:quercetin dioxygenase-like cupin family protein
MKLLHVTTAASEAVGPNPNRPATATLHDCADLRLVVFRLEAGQSVPLHRSTSTVTLTAIAGQGFIRGGNEELAVSAGETIVFEPNEFHGMRAAGCELILLATITPRPGGDRATTRAEPHAVSADAS